MDQESLQKISPKIKRVTIEVRHQENGIITHHLVTDLQNESDDVRGVEVIAILNQGIEMVL